jgi:hypothetical protein
MAAARRWRPLTEHGVAEVRVSIVVLGMRERHASLSSRGTRPGSGLRRSPQGRRPKPAVWSEIAYSMRGEPSVGYSNPASPDVAAVHRERVVLVAKLEDRQAVNDFVIEAMNSVSTSPAGSNRPVRRTPGRTRRPSMTMPYTSPGCAHRDDTRTAIDVGEHVAVWARELGPPARISMRGHDP